MKLVERSFREKFHQQLKYVERLLDQGEDNNGLTWLYQKMMKEIPQEDENLEVEDDSKPGLNFDRIQFRNEEISDDEQQENNVLIQSKIKQLNQAKKQLKKIEKKLITLIDDVKTGALQIDDDL